jgi:hypothetical protein
LGFDHFEKGSACIPVAFALICLPPMLNMLQLLLTSAHLYDDGAKVQ